VRADFGEPIEVGDKVILDVRPYRRDEHGNKTDNQRLWQVLTMREGRIVRIQDYTDRATALQAAGLPTSL
jgi:ketosteroid isomerase-like protein